VEWKEDFDMGWTYSTKWNTKNDMLHYLVGTFPNDSCHFVAKEQDYSILWTVSPFKSSKIIVCTLLQPSGNGWGYKMMDEVMGPFFYSCPIEFLELTDSSEYKNDGWRLNVIEFHSQLV
jgi:hypothetical protein